MKLPKKIIKQIGERRELEPVLVIVKADDYLEGDITYLSDVLLDMAKDKLSGVERAWLVKEYECGYGYGDPGYEYFSLWATRMETEEEFEQRKQQIIDNYQQELEQKRLKKKKKEEAERKLMTKLLKKYGDK